MKKALVLILSVLLILTSCKKEKAEISETEWHIASALAGFVEKARNNEDFAFDVFTVADKKFKFVYQKDRLWEFYCNNSLIRAEIDNNKIISLSRDGDEIKSLKNFDLAKHFMDKNIQQMLFVDIFELISQVSYQERQKDTFRIEKDNEVLQFDMKNNQGTFRKDDIFAILRYNESYGFFVREIKVGKERKLIYPRRK